MEEYAQLWLVVYVSPQQVQLDNFHNFPKLVSLEKHGRKSVNFRTRSVEIIDSTRL